MLSSRLHPILESFAQRCSNILVRTLHVAPCVKAIETVDVVDGSNTIPFLSYLIHTYFMYPENHANSDLLMSLMTANAKIGNAIVQDNSSSGKYLLQVGLEGSCQIDLLQVHHAAVSSRVCESQL